MSINYVITWEHPPTFSPCHQYVNMLRYPLLPFSKPLKNITNYNTGKKLRKILLLPPLGVMEVRNREGQTDNVKLIIIIIIIIRSGEYVMSILVFTLKCTSYATTMCTTPLISICKYYLDLLSTKMTPLYHFLCLSHFLLHNRVNSHTPCTIGLIFTTRAKLFN